MLTVTEDWLNPSLLLDQVNDAIIAVDPRHRILAWNRAAEAIYGWQAGEVRGKILADVIQTVRYLDGSTADQVMDDFIARGAWQGEVIQTRRDGQEVVVEASVRLVHDAARQPLAYVAINRDITKRHRAEQALRRSEEQYSAVVDNVKEVIFQTDVDGNWTFLNAAWTEITGFAMDASLGRPFLEYVHPEDRERDWNLFTPDTGRAKEYTHQEVRFLTHDGGFRWIEANARVLTGADGALTGTAGTLQDITERKQVEEALRLAKEEAEQANRAKSGFLSHMSHELRTPLNAILGFTEVLAGEPLTPDQIEYTQYITNAGTHLLGLIDDVLDLSRIDTDALRLVLQPVDPLLMIREAIEMVRPQAAAQRIEIKTVASKLHVAQVIADPQRLKQILLNLLSNAVKYNRPGGAVIVTTDNDGGRVRIAVRDTGAGIRPEHIERLFTPFDRLGAERSAIGGVGLGLALSRQLVERMGGTIGVESVIDTGSTFWIELPLAAA